MKRRTFSIVGAGLLAAGALAACGGGGSHDGSVEPDPPEAPPQTKVVFGSNQGALLAVRVTMPGPRMAARALAAPHTAMYDA